MDAAQRMEGSAVPHRVACRSVAIEALRRVGDRVMADSTPTPPHASLAGPDAATLAELLRRLREINHCYRAAAEKMGQL